MLVVPCEYIPDNLPREIISIRQKKTTRQDDVQKEKTNIDLVYGLLVNGDPELEVGLRADICLY